MSIPAPRTPVGEPTAADKTRAADALSGLLNRDARTGSHLAYTLARDFALVRLEGYEQAQREQVGA